MTNNISKILVLRTFTGQEVNTETTNGFGYSLDFSGYTFDQLKDLNQVFIVDIDDDRVEAGSRNRYTATSLLNCQIDVDSVGRSVASWNLDKINEVYEGDEVPIELFTMVDRDESDGSTPPSVASVHNIAESNALFFYIDSDSKVTAYLNGSDEDAKTVPQIELSSDAQDALMQCHQGLISLTEAVIKLYDCGIHISHLSHVANKDKTIAVVQLPFANKPTAWYTLTADYGLKTDDDWPLLNRLVVAI